MIFKVIFGNTFQLAGNNNTYVSICSKHLDIGGSVFKLKLYKILSQKTILSAPYSFFNYEMPMTYGPGRIIKCFVHNNTKNKLFCKLEELLPYKAPRSKTLRDYGFPETLRWDGSISSIISARANNEIARQIDNEIIGELNAVAGNFAVPGHVAQSSILFGGTARNAADEVLATAGPPAATSIYYNRNVANNEDLIFGGAALNVAGFMNNGDADIE